MNEKCLVPYGNIREKYLATGKMSIAGDKEADIDFIFAQKSDGGLIFCAELKDLRSIPEVEIGHQISMVSGILDNGDKINLDGNLLLLSSKFQFTETEQVAQIYGIPNQWTIGELRIKKSLKIVFEIANLKLGLDLIIQIGNKEISIKATPDYKETIERLRATRGIEVTANFELSIENEEELEEIITIVDTLCDLLSVAKTTLVTWLSFYIIDDKKLKIYSRYRNAITKPFNSSELILHTDNEGLLNFLDNGYTRYEQFNEIFIFRKLIRQFIETKSRSFIETRGLIMAVQIEFLANRLSNYENRVTYLEPFVFEEKLEEFQMKTKVILKELFPDLSKNLIDGMSSKLIGFNYRGLTGKIKKLNKWLDAGLTSNEIQMYVDIRNELAHRGSYPKDLEPVTYFRIITRLLDRLMLRLFDYRGKYYDIKYNIISEI